MSKFLHWPAYVWGLLYTKAAKIERLLSFLVFFVSWLPAGFKVGILSWLPVSVTLHTSEILDQYPSIVVIGGGFFATVAIVAYSAIKRAHHFDFPEICLEAVFQPKWNQILIRLKATGDAIGQEYWVRIKRIGPSSSYDGALLFLADHQPGKDGRPLGTKNGTDLLFAKVAENKKFQIILKDGNGYDFPIQPNTEVVITAEGDDGRSSDVSFFVSFIDGVIRFQNGHDDE